jgi:uncharacterized Zn-finger protein
MYRNNAYHPRAGRVNRQGRRNGGTMPAFETIFVDGQVAACNGGGGPLGHPRVYLNLGARGRVECPYCSRLFVRRGEETAQDAECPPLTPGGPHPPAPASEP